MDRLLHKPKLWHPSTRRYCEWIPVVEDQAGTADALCEIVTTVLKRFIPDSHEKLEYVITDTTAVMPKTVRLLNTKWMPCWAHVLNLMLNDLIEQITPILKPILDLVKLTSSSTKWASLVQDARYSTLPTYRSTRWCPMQRLIQNADRIEEREPDTYSRRDMEGGDDNDADFEHVQVFHRNP
jgi:hypothetical protein